MKVKQRLRFPIRDYVEDHQHDTTCNCSMMLETVCLSVGRWSRGFTFIWPVSFKWSDETSTKWLSLCSVWDKCLSCITRMKGHAPGRLQREPWCSSDAMNVRGRFLLTRALLRYQYLMNQLWCITYHQVKSCLVRNAVLGRICARVGGEEKKNESAQHVQHVYGIVLKKVHCIRGAESFQTPKRGFLTKKKKRRCCTWQIPYNKPW